jgi:hypothetical protein
MHEIESILPADAIIISICGVFRGTNTPCREKALRPRPLRLPVLETSTGRKTVGMWNLSPALLTQASNYA